MLRSTPRRSSGLVLAALSLLLVGCEQVTDPPVDAEPARLTVQANVSATTIATMVVTVTAVDISPPLVFNVPITPGGVAQETIQIPAGSNRKLEIDAYDANQIKTHHGEQMISSVKPGGGNNRITVILLPIAGQQPVRAEFGIFVVTVNPPAISLTVGASQPGVTATVKDDKGNVPPDYDASKLQWATTDPSVFSISAGVVTALKAGSATLVATYEGYAGTATVTVVAATPPTP